MGMTDVKITKVTLNIGAGGDIERLKSAERLLNKLTGQKTTRTTAKASHPELGVKKYAPVGTKVTIRGQKAMEFLPNAFEAIENTLRKSQITNDGNFSFGVKEYLELPGMKYDPDIGMFGFDVCVTLERPGTRIKKRRLQKKKMPAKLKITQDEIITFLQKEFKVVIE